MASRRRNSSIVTLTTDFGTADHYVGVMKGVILGICPDARIVDISHEIPPYEITSGSFLLARTWPYFPERTVHVGVVDPGVGTARRPLLIEAHGQFFLGPDNGLFAMVYADSPHTARVVTNESLFLRSQSRTFHGRDIFAPVAAHLASGIPAEETGPIVLDHLKSNFHKPQRTSRRLWTGVVLHVDRYGNMITNFHIDEFADLSSRPFELVVGPAHISRLGATFADGAPGEIFAVIGSSGYLEVVINQDSAAKILGCGIGAPAELELF